MKFAVLCLSFLSALAYCEESIEGEGEELATIPQTLAKYFANDEGNFSPNGPIVDQMSTLTFVDTWSWKQLIVVSGGSVKLIPRDPGFLSITRGATGLFFTSQQGLTYYGGYILFGQNGIPAEFDDRDFVSIQNRPENTDLYVYPTGDTVVMDYPSKGTLFSLELSKGKVVKVRSTAETSAWLADRKSNFQVGTDGHLYHNGFLWSATRPKKIGERSWRYLGRLMSGHTVWSSSMTDFEIVDSNGNSELSLSISVATQFDLSIGPWGELYYLFAPPMKKGLNPQEDFYQPEPGVPARLAVFRNHLKYFGRLNDGGVRLRGEASVKGQILGTYPAKTGFRILEKGTIEEQVGSQKNFWYKIRLLDGKEGWFFGAFVQSLYDGPNGSSPPWPNVPDW